MAIAPSELGRAIAEVWTLDESSDDALVGMLRRKRLVRRLVSDAMLTATFRRAREEHAQLPAGGQEFNSPHERVRVFLNPYLTFKGRRWSVPLRRWWQFWR